MVFVVRMEAEYQDQKLMSVLVGECQIVVLVNV